MTCTRFRLAVAAVSLVLLSACGVVSSAETAASVDDDSLTHTQLNQLITAAATANQAPNQPATTTARLIDQNAARQVLSLWIADRALSSEAQQRSIDVPDLPNAPTLADYNQHVATTFEKIRQDVSKRNELGTAMRSRMCIGLINTAKEETAREVLGRFEAGASFVEAVQGQNVQAAGVIGCFERGQIARRVAESTGQARDGAVAQRAITLQPGETAGPIVTESGVWLAHRAAFDELPPQSQAAVADVEIWSNIISRHDIYVASIYGTFDESGVRPLG